MKQIIKTTLLLLSILPLTAMADGDKRISRGEYIDIWKDVAIRNMVEHKIPASITLAQGILESGDGNSELAAKYNNHFGIKCHSDWKGKKTYHDDDRRGECFRHYRSAAESFQDHSEFLERKRYASLFELKITDYKGWARGLKKCGYATSKIYAKQLIELIEINNLRAFDKIGVKMIKEGKIWDEEVLALEEPANEHVEDQAAAKLKENADFETVEGDLASNTSIVVNPQRYIKISNNKIKYVLAYSGETAKELAKRMELMPWQIVKYNDLDKEYVFANNEIVYIQPKRGKAKTKSHIVAEGETIRDISQQYGIKIKKVLKLNGLEKGAEVPAGSSLKLR